MLITRLSPGPGDNTLGAGGSVVRKLASSGPFWGSFCAYIDLWGPFFRSQWALEMPLHSLWGPEVLVWGPGWGSQARAGQSGRYVVSFRVAKHD